jgi:hypothetical protein
MSKGETRFELILLFRDTGFEPKKLHKWLLDHGQIYPYSTMKKYYGYYGTADLKEKAIMRGKI